MSFWCCFRTRTCERRNVVRRWCPGRPTRRRLAPDHCGHDRVQYGPCGTPEQVVVRVDSESAKGSGLLMDSVTMTDNLATIQYSEIDRILGALSELRELDAALRTTQIGRAHVSTPVT